MYLLCKIEPQIQHIHSSTPEGIVEGIAEANEFWDFVLIPGRTIPYPVAITLEQWLNKTLNWIEINNEWWFYTTDENLWKKYNETASKK